MPAVAAAAGPAHTAVLAAQVAKLQRELVSERQRRQEAEQQLAVKESAIAELRRQLAEAQLLISQVKANLKLK